MVPSNQERGHWPKEERLSRGPLWLILAAGVLTFLVWLQRAHQAELDFIAKCIEFHDVKRCEVFWNYRRTDLGEKPGVR